MTKGSKERLLHARAGRMLFLISGAVSFLAACGGNAGPAAPLAKQEAKELTVFAAASLTETLTELAAGFEAENPGIKVVFNFDSSGTLKTQIEEGAVCDVFLSAGEKQMDALAAEKLILENTRADILENSIVLAVPDSEAEGAVMSFDDMADRLSDGTITLAMGNSDVPAGQYAEKLLEYYDLSAAALSGEGCISYGANAKEIALQVREASVDCGLIYATDAAVLELPVVDIADRKMCGSIIYPAAVILEAEHPETAEAFLSFLSGNKAVKVFETAGFISISKE